MHLRAPVGGLPGFPSQLLLWRLYKCVTSWKISMALTSHFSLKCKGKKHKAETQRHKDTGTEFFFLRHPLCVMLVLLTQHSKCVSSYWMVPESLHCKWFFNFTQAAQGISKLHFSLEFSRCCWSRAVSLNVPLKHTLIVHVWVYSSFQLPETVVQLHSMTIPSWPQFLPY